MPRFRDAIEKGADGWNVDFTRPIADGPTAVGFDEFFGISRLARHGAVHLHRQRPRRRDPDGGQGVPHDARPAGEHDPQGAGRGGFRGRGRPADDDGPRRRDDPRRADAARAGTPFFLYLALAAPHTPIAPTDSWLGRSGLNPYADFVMQVDAAVGEVLAALDERRAWPGRRW